MSIRDKLTRGLNKKALEALKKEAANDAAMAEELAAKATSELDNPSLKEQLQRLNLKNLPEQQVDQGFDLVGSPYSKDFTLGEAGPISQLPKVMPEVQLPIMSNSGVPAIRPTKVIDVEPISVSSANDGKIPLTEKQLSDWKKKLALIGAGGTAAAALYSSGAGESSKQASSMPPVNTNTAPKQPEPTLVQSDPVDTLLKAQIAQNAPSKPFELDLGEDQIRAASRIKEAQDRANEIAFVNQIGKAGELIGSSITGAKPIAQGSFDENIKGAYGLVDRIKDQIQAEKDDPNSAKSKAYRQMFAKIGINIKGTPSASDLERIYPQAVNLYSAEEARKAKREMAQMALAQRAEDKKIKQEAKKEDFTQSFRKELTSGAMKDLFNAYQKSDQAVGRIQKAIQSPSGYQDLGNLYGYLKSLDDQSAVREGELALGLKQGSIPQRLHGRFKQYLTGEMVAPEQRRQMEEVIVGYANQNREAYLNAIKPVLEQAQRIGVSPEEITRDIASQPYSILPRKQQPISAPPAAEPVGRSGLTPAQRQQRIQQLRNQLKQGQ